MNDLQAQTAYKVAVNWEDIDPEKKVFFPVPDLEVSEVLRISLAGTDFTWEVKGDQIIITHEKIEIADPYGPKIYYFPIAKTELQYDFKTNGIMLRALDALLSDQTIVSRIDSILVTAAASPIGNRTLNDRLSQERANALKDYIVRRHPGIDTYKMYSYPVGIDWDGFWSIAEHTPELPSQSKVLELKGAHSEAQTLAQLRTVGGNTTYQYLLNQVYPRLQYAAVRVVLDDGQSFPPVGSPIKQIVEPVILRDTVWMERVVRDTIYQEQIVLVETPVVIPPPEPIARKPFYIALKTNLLYDGALLPNLAIEIPFGKDYRWSAAIDGNWSWWNTSANDYFYHRIQMAGMELRYWFGDRTDKNPLNGWYIGAYGYGGDYDVRLFTKKNSDEGEQSLWSYSAGLTGGYAMPIGRQLNLEFGIGAGYFGGEYKRYVVSDCADGVFPLRSIHKRNYWGLTKANISLVWVIETNKNRRKEVLR